MLVEAALWQCGRRIGAWAAKHSRPSACALAFVRKHTRNLLCAHEHEQTDCGAPSGLYRLMALPQEVLDLRDVLEALKTTCQDLKRRNFDRERCAAVRVCGLCGPVHAPRALSLDGGGVTGMGGRPRRQWRVCVRMRAWRCATCVNPHQVLALASRREVARGTGAGPPANGHARAHACTAGWLAVLCRALPNVAPMGARTPAACLTRCGAGGVALDVGHPWPWQAQPACLACHVCVSLSLSLSAPAPAAAPGHPGDGPLVPARPIYQLLPLSPPSASS